MRVHAFTPLLAAALAFGGLASAKDSPDEKRAKIIKMASETLDKLYQLQPSSREAIDSKTNRPTFMKMISAGAGLGLGVKDYRVVFVFDNREAMDKFVNSGWDASGQADAAAKTKKSGGAYSGAVSVAPGVWVYQITERGLALQLTLQGTKYYKDDDLNKPQPP